jgi:hypothetical protein
VDGPDSNKIRPRILLAGGIPDTVHQGVSAAKLATSLRKGNKGEGNCSRFQQFRTEVQPNLVQGVPQEDSSQREGKQQRNSPQQLTGD